jgi:1-phosphofructokinase
MVEVQAHRDLRATGQLVAVDSSGPTLTQVLSQQGDRLPHMVKSNVQELAEVANRDLTTLGDVADAAQVLLARGVRTVLISLGRNGTLLVDADLAQPPHATAVEHEGTLLGVPDPHRPVTIAPAEA